MSDSTPVGGAALVDGVDVDAVAAAVRTCAGVERLPGGRPQDTATYLPGRRIEGVRIERSVVLVQVRARWGVPAPELAGQIRRAVAPLVAGRRIDIVVAEVGDPPAAPPPQQVTAPARARRAPRPRRGEEPEWTTANALAGHNGESSSAATIPTAAATPPPSSPV